MAYTTHSTKDSSTRVTSSTTSSLHSSHSITTHHHCGTPAASSQSSAIFACVAYIILLLILCPLFFLLFHTPIKPFIGHGLSYCFHGLGLIRSLDRITHHRIVNSIFVALTVLLVSFHLLHPGSNHSSVRCTI